MFLTKVWQDSYTILVDIENGIAHFIFSFLNYKRECGFTFEFFTVLLWRCLCDRLAKWNNFCLLLLSYPALFLGTLGIAEPVPHCKCLITSSSTRSSSTSPFTSWSRSYLSFLSLLAMPSLCQIAKMTRPAIITSATVMIAIIPLWRTAKICFGIIVITPFQKSVGVSFWFYRREASTWQRNGSPTCFQITGLEENRRKYDSPVLSMRWMMTLKQVDWKTSPTSLTASPHTMYSPIGRFLTFGVIISIVIIVIIIINNTIINHCQQKS